VKTFAYADGILTTKPEGIDPDIWLIICSETMRTTRSKNDPRPRPLSIDDDRRQSREED
jgi:hypothetical protein